MSQKEIIHCDKLTPGRGPLSQAARFGNLVFVQGCTGRHPTTGAVGKDIKEQTRFALERIRMILEESGTSLDNVLTNTCYVTRQEDLAGFNEVYAEYFKEDRPARTAIIVNFGAPDYLVEITSTACIPTNPGSCTIGFPFILRQAQDERVSYEDERIPVNGEFSTFMVSLSNHQCQELSSGSQGFYSH